jgi:hypothetical protein
VDGRFHESDSTQPVSDRDGAQKARRRSVSPAKRRRDAVEEYLPDYEPHKLPTGYSAVYAALEAAVQSGRLNHPFGIKIRVADLREWLVERRVKSKFFFPDGVPAADYLNPSDSCFSPKLSAAVKAWEAIRANPFFTKARSPKQALIKWLNEHATELGLADDDGRPITKAIEDVATVANWNTTGGAPKTPTAAISAKSEEPDPLDWILADIENS